MISHILFSESMQVDVSLAKGSLREVQRNTEGLLQDTPVPYLTTFYKKKGLPLHRNLISILRQSLFYMTHHISIVLGKGPRLFGILILEIDLIT